jgi:hypothetical protein
MAGTDHSSSLPWLFGTFSQILSLFLVVFQFMPAWGWLQKLLPHQACSSKDTASSTEGAAAESALVVAQVMTCSITTDAAKLPPTCEEGDSSTGSALQEDAVLSQQQLQEAQQAAAAAQSKAAELADELKRTQQRAAEAQHKAAMLEGLYQQVCRLQVQRDRNTCSTHAVCAALACCCLGLPAGNIVRQECIASSLG